MNDGSCIGLGEVALFRAAAAAMLRVNAGSRVALGTVALFRAAAAARATFLAGKVAKAIHAAACAVLRTMTSFAHPALRKSRCPRLLPRALDAARPACWQVASATSRPALLAGRLVRSRILLRGQAQPAPSGRGRAAHALRPARTRPSMGSNKRAFPSRPAVLLGAGQRYERQRQRQRQQRVLRPRMAIGAPRAGTRTRAAGAAVGVGFLWFLSLPIKERNPRGGSRTEQDNLAQPGARTTAHTKLRSNSENDQAVIPAQSLPPPFLVIPAQAGIQ